MTVIVVSTLRSLTQSIGQWCFQFSVIMASQMLCSVLFMCSILTRAVIVDGGIFESLDATAGVLQGYVLAPLFVIILVKNLLTCEADLVVVTYYLDNIALPESLVPRAQSQLSGISDVTADLGLIINAPKTEFMNINCQCQTGRYNLRHNELFYGCESWAISKAME